MIAYSFMLSRNIEWTVCSYISTGKEEGYGGRFFFGKCIDQNYKNGIGHLSDCTVFPDSTDRRICGIGCVISAGVVFGYYYRMAMKNFGGVTGDLCGYFLQVCELVMALVVVVVDIVVKSGIIK